MMYPPSREVFEDLHRAAEGTFGVNDPLKGILQGGETVFVF